MSDPDKLFRAARRATVLALLGGVAPAMAQETTWEFLANFDRPFIGRETARKIILLAVEANSDPTEFLADENAVDVADMGAVWRVTLQTNHELKLREAWGDVPQVHSQQAERPHRGHSIARETRSRTHPLWEGLTHCGSLL